METKNHKIMSFYVRRYYFYNIIIIKKGEINRFLEIESIFNSG